MTHYTFSMQSSDTMSDRSDVQSLLKTIDHLYMVSRSVLNDHTQTTLRMAIAIEGQMLQAKLQTMGRRWRLHLPFKEACQVDFYDWARRMETISSEIRSDGSEDEQQKRDIYCPSKHFLLDLYAMISESDADSQPEKPYYEEPDATLFVKRQDDMRKKIVGHWKDTVRKVSDQTISDLSTKQDQAIALTYDPTMVRQICSDVLSRLSEELFSLNGRLTSPISKKDFTRLADRIMKEREYGGTKALARANVSVNTWRNKTPYDMMASERQAEIDRAIEKIGKTKYGGTLLQNIRINDDFDRQKERFGKFLFSVRKEITKDELLELFDLLFLIHQFRQLSVTDPDEPEETDATVSPVQPADGVQQPSAAPAYPDLPTEFDQSFRENVKAVVTFYRLLSEAGPYIGRPRKTKSKSSAAEVRFGKWKWLHLKSALVRLKLIVGTFSNRDFADFMNSVFPDRSSDSIYRSLYRLDDTNSPAIIADIIRFFHPVKDLMSK